MMTHRIPAALMVSALLAACGGAEGTDDTAGQPQAGAAAGGAPLSEVELTQGIGPIRDLALGPVDPALASTGEDAFVLKCSACHKIEERYVAPELGTVLSRRRPEYVMNMILNSTEMVQRHPEARALLTEFYTPMPVQVTEQEEARAILEYLRSAQLSSQ